MKQYLQFYIDGKWVDPAEPNKLKVINPATEQAFAEISMVSKPDVDIAVAAARKAFKSYSNFSVQERTKLMENEEEAIEIANDTEYGLAGYVSSGDMKHTKQVARQIRAGQVSHQLC